MNKKYDGGCLCGNVRYSALRKLREVIYCYCKQCQRTSGNFVAASGVLRDSFNLVKSKTLVWYKSSEKAKRGFCSNCGSNLFWDCEDSKYISIFAGTLDGEPVIKASHHIFYDQKPLYLTMEDDLPVE